MTPDWFAARLASGAPAGTRKTSWWPRHTRDVARCLSLPWRRQGPILQAAHKALHAWCAEWESMAGCGHGLMAEHGRLETALMEAAARNDAPAIGRAGELLIANIHAQTELHGSVIAEFPGVSYTKLLEEHVSVFVESVRLRMQGNVRVLERCDARLSQNALALAAFTAEWF